MNHLNVQITWEEARQSCLSNNANLTSITSSEENKFVFNLAGRETIWIGGTIEIDDESKSQADDSFAWTDGTPWGKTFWAKNEPNRSGAEHCINMRNTTGGLWNDSVCRNRFKFVCKIKMQ